MTDYAVLILANLALHDKKLLTAKEIASETHISLPTTQKILKKLNRKNLVISQSHSALVMTINVKLRIFVTLAMPGK
jgi:DNA-binding IscR family transcriptional regulator